MRVNAFTADTDVRARIIETPTAIWKAFDPTKTKEWPPSKEFKAIWDTGATNSVITRKVIEECGLEPIGMVEAHTVAGTKASNSYLVNIGLPNRVLAPGIRVTEGEIYGDYDILIGMDIISHGDFAFTNKNGKSTFSFRIPSLERIDFVEELKSKQPKIGRNDPCPCGSGLKYKKCCGKQT
jgi:predicted aspartyl protease